MSMPDWGGSSCFDEIERAVLFYTDDLMLHRGRVLDSAFAVLKKSNGRKDSGIEL